MTDRSDRNDQHRRDEDFVRRVLGATSGSPCERAAALLPDLTDGALEDFDRQLVQAHLEHCSACRAVAVALGWLQPLLPEMAELDPGEEFTQAVLERTTLAAPGIAAGPVTEPGGFGPAGWMDRIGRWWQDNLLRPVFPLQVAYAATLVLVLLTATPVSPFRHAPGRVLEIVQAGPTALPGIGPRLDGAGERTAVWLDDRTAGVRDAARREATGAWGRAVSSLTERRERTADPRGEAREHLARLGGNLRRGKLGEAGYELHRMMQAAGRAWSLWWNPQANESNAENEQPVIERSTP